MRKKGTCDDCGEWKTVHRRKKEGLLLCALCIHQRRPLAQCVGCSNLRRCRYFSRGDKKPLCDNCYKSGHTALCAWCGRVKPVAVRMVETPYCTPCGRRFRAKVRCARC